MRGIVRVVYLRESIILLTSMGGGAGRGGELCGQRCGCLNQSSSLKKKTQSAR